MQRTKLNPMNYLGCRGKVVTSTDTNVIPKEKSCFDVISFLEAKYSPSHKEFDIVADQKFVLTRHLFSVNGMSGLLVVVVVVLIK